MRKLSIPFTQDNKMLDILGDNAKYVKEIFMPLPYDVFPSGRPYSGQALEEYRTLMESNIQRAKGMGIEVSMLATKVILDVDTGVTMMIRASNEIQRLKELYDIDKIVISNYAFLTHYGEHLKSMGMKVEISVMADIDCVEKVEHIMTLFPFVDSICLDNSFIFMHDDMLYLKEKYPGLDLKILVNHGCLINCASHHQHHHYLSGMRYEMDTSDPEKWRLASNDAQLHPPSKICTAYSERNEINPLRETAHIRPEDLHLYDDVIDMYKLSGREGRAEDMIEFIRAFGERKFDGDLTEIFDRPYTMTPIDNSKITKDYAVKKLNCHHRCHKCNHCDNMFQKAMIKLETQE